MRSLMLSVMPVADAHRLTIQCVEQSTEWSILSWISAMQDAAMYDSVDDAAYWFCTHAWSRGLKICNTTYSLVYYQRRCQRVPELHLHRRYAPNVVPIYHLQGCDLLLMLSPSALWQSPINIVFYIFEGGRSRDPWDSSERIVPIPQLPSDDSVYDYVLCHSADNIHEQCSWSGCVPCLSIWLACCILFSGIDSMCDAEYAHFHISLSHLHTHTHTRSFYCSAWTLKRKPLDWH